MANDAEFSSTLSENDQAHLSEYILPLPKAAPLRKASGRRRGKTRIFTDPSVRKEVAGRVKERNAKKTKKEYQKADTESEKAVISKEITKLHNV